MATGPAANKLLDVAGTPFLPSTSLGLSGLERFGGNGQALEDLLKEKNGFFCFEQALRIFPSATTDQSWGVNDWNRHDLWKEDYRGLADGVMCFAEDIFGNQFCISNGTIHSFNPETAEVAFLAETIEDWASQIVSDYNVMTGYGFAHEWQEINGILPARHRLMPKHPFVLGGEYELSNLVSMDSVRVMKNLGNLAHQIYDLPDGAEVRFKIL